MVRWNKRSNNNQNCRKLHWTETKGCTERPNAAKRIRFFVRNIIQYNICLELGASITHPICSHRHKQTIGCCFPTLQEYAFVSILSFALKLYSIGDGSCSPLMPTLTRCFRLRNVFSVDLCSRCAGNAYWRVLDANGWHVKNPKKMATMKIKIGRAAAEYWLNVALFIYLIFSSMLVFCFVWLQARAKGFYKPKHLF